MLSSCNYSRPPHSRSRVEPRGCKRRELLRRKAELESRNAELEQENALLKAEVAALQERLTEVERRLAKLLTQDPKLQRSRSCTPQGGTPPPFPKSPSFAAAPATNPPRKIRGATPS